MFQYSPILGRSSIWDLKYTFSEMINVFSFVQWNKYFHSVKDEFSIQLGSASLNGTFHLSPHENICTIALINIHYLYNANWQLYAHFVIAGHIYVKRFCFMTLLESWQDRGVLSSGNPESFSTLLHSIPHIHS